MEWIDFICDTCEHNLGYGRCKAFPNFEDEAAIVVKTNKHDSVIKGQTGNWVYSPVKDKKEGK